MKIIFEGNKTVIVEEFSIDDVEALKNIGKDVHIADGNIIVEEKEV